MSIGPVSSTSKIGYTPGSIYKRFGQFGLFKSRNMQSMNRRTVESYNSAFVTGGAQLFDFKASESQGKSELAAQQLLQRVQQEAKAASKTTINLGALLNTSA